MAADIDCKKCSGNGLIRNGRFYSTCICIYKNNIKETLKKFGEIQFKKPTDLSKSKPLIYIKTDMFSFKNDLAGYLLANHPQTFSYLSIQDLFALRWEAKNITELIDPDLLVLDFIGLVPNKLLPMFVNQVVEERSIYPNKNTWLISRHSKSDLLHNLASGRDGVDDSLRQLRLSLEKAPSISRGARSEASTGPELGSTARKELFYPDIKITI